LNWIDVAPAPTVTDVGVLSSALLSDTVTAVPLVGAACEIVTVQTEVELDAIVPGEHCKEVTVGRTAPATVIALPVPETASDDPSPKAPSVPVTPMETEEPLVDADKVTVTTATTPLPMAVVFIPTARHFVDPVAEAQVTALPAADAAVPVATATEATSLAE